MTELKPCPFCGGEVKLVTDFSQNKDHVYCFECEECGALVYMDDLIDKDKSIEAWNKRPNHWHTGTPAEEGWYLLAVKHGEKIHYNANRLYSCGEWFYSKLGEVLAYQKIEPYEASKEG